MAHGSILIVDDEGAIRRLVRSVLTKAGYDVIEAEDGEMAMNTMKTGEQADSVLAVICDLQMPKVDGVETIEYIRTQFPSVPVVVLTGKPDMSVAVMLIKKGVSDYLLKPFDPDMLIAAVHRAVKGHVPRHHCVA